MELIPEEVLKLGLSILVGGLIGAEREYRDKSAGLRTIIFITLGSTLFTMLSLGIGNETNPTRIAANIVTGIGFLGAGAILREGTKIAGLTTASTIWLAASLGMGLGAGRYALVGLFTLAILVILWLFPFLEIWTSRMRETRTYEIVLPLDSPQTEGMARKLAEYGLKVLAHKESRQGSQARLTFLTFGRPASQVRFTKMLMQDPEILEFNY